MQIRQATSDLTAYTLDLQKHTIPAKAVLYDFRAGPGHEGPAQNNPEVVSFRYEGQLYFNVLHEVMGKTAVVNASST
jgi:hypothetical protein